MRPFNRSFAPDTARALAKELTDRGVTLPADIESGLAKLDRITEAAPHHPGARAIEDAYRAEVDAGQIAAVAADAVTFEPLCAAHREAMVREGLTVCAAFEPHGDTLITALAEVAAPLIAELEHLAKLDQGIDALVRAGRHEDASCVARGSVIAADLEALFGVRAQIAQGADYGTELGADCQRFRDPRALGYGSRAETILDGYLLGIRQGAKLWFPTPEQAREQAGVIIAEVKANAQRAAIAGAAHGTRHDKAATTFA